MQHALMTLSQVPLRAEPRHSSEMLSQALFGDRLEVFGREAEWSQVRLLLDGYEGWIPTAQLRLLSAEQAALLEAQEPRFVGDPVQTVETPKGVLNLSLGSRWPDFAAAGMEEERTWRLIGSAPVGVFLPSSWRVLAEKYLGAPYLWGGSSIFGIDCSGFSQRVWCQCGILLPRNASDQAQQGITVNCIHEAQAGDLLFFDNADGKIVHVGMYLGSNEIIHASGRVRVDAVDQEGIFNRELGVYTHAWRVGKRVF